MIRPVVSFFWTGYKASSQAYEVIKQFDRDSVIQMVIVCSMPILLMIIPALAKIYIPVLSCAFVYLHVRQTLSQINENEKLKKSNEELEGIHRELLKVTEEFKQAINKHVKMQEGASNPSLKETLEELKKLFQIAKDDNAVVDLLATIEQLNRQLAEDGDKVKKLNDEFAKLVAEVKALIQEKEKLHDHK